jgi:hypothetical protein
MRSCVHALSHVFDEAQQWLKVKDKNGLLDRFVDFDDNVISAINAIKDDVDVIPGRLKAVRSREVYCGFGGVNW